MRTHSFAIHGAAAATLCLALGCSQTSAPTDATGTTDALDVGLDQFTPPPRDAAPRDVLMPPAITRSMSEAALLPQRRTCAFHAGAWPAETLGTEMPIGRDIPIDHVIFLMQENRSFDNYFGRLVPQGVYQGGDFSTAADGTRGSGFAHPDQVDVPRADWSQPDGNGGTVLPHPDDAYCYGVNHGWRDMHDDYDNGAMDHFVTNNNPNGQRSMYFEDSSVIPFYYALADTFAIGDQYHASVMTSTWPNRLFAMAATSFGIGDNSFVTQDTAAHPVTQIFSMLEAGNHTWRDYTDGPHQVSFFLYYGFRTATTARFGTARCDLMRDIANNTLPDVAYVMGDEVNGTSDEGPSALPGIGGAWVEGILRALFASPAWAHTAVFVTYDENGGMADHVPPERACPPDGLAPHDGDNNPLPGAFDQTGFRVPFTVISPYARRHFVSHQVYDHTSILRFIEARFGLPAMTDRDANATPPMEMFDFQNPPFVTPPTIAAHTTVPDAVLMHCGQHYAPLGCGGDGGT
jgi:phospholipase C